MLVGIGAIVAPTAKSADSKNDPKEFYMPKTTFME